MGVERGLLLRGAGFAKGVDYAWDLADRVFHGGGQVYRGC